MKTGDRVMTCMEHQCSSLECMYYEVDNKLGDENCPLCGNSVMHTMITNDFMDLIKE